MNHLLRLLAALAALAGISVVSLSETTAFAADQNPPKAAKVAPATVAAASPFYIGAWAGAGFSKTQNELTIPGTVTGPISAYPTGMMPGLTLGYANNSGSIYYGAAIDIGYDFSKGSIGGFAPGAGLPAIGYRKNGFFIDEVGEVGINMATIAGYIPGGAQPQNWPIPITVPASAWSNLIVAARGGLAQRNVDLCATVDLAGNAPCASKFINGPLAGVKVKAMISANTEVFATYDHIWWNSSFTPAQAQPIFANTISAKEEDLFRVGFGYHF